MTESRKHLIHKEKSPSHKLHPYFIYYYEKHMVKGDSKTTEFAWITSIRITKSNARKIVRAGRNRWKIENQGSNRQKHWQGNIEHAIKAVSSKLLHSQYSCVLL